MTIDKAIRNLLLSLTNSTMHHGQDTYKSIELGIEALRRIRENRLVNNHPDQAKLPGETKE